MKINIACLLVAFTLIATSISAQKPRNTIQEVINIEAVSAIPGGLAINCIFVDDDNSKWVGTDKGLYRVNNLKSGNAVNQSSGVTNSTRGGVGKDWVALRNGAIITAKSSDKVNLLEKSGDNPRINCIEKIQGELWVGTDDGIYVIDPFDKRIIEHYHVGNTKLLTNQVNDILFNSGAKWIATDKGLYRVKDNNWKNYERATRFYRLNQSKAGVWALSQETLWNIDRNNRWFPVDLDGRLRTETVQDVAFDGQGTIYLVSEALVKYNPYKNKSKKIDERYGFATKTSSCIAVDKDGFLWIGTETDGLFRVEFTEEVSGELSALCFVDQEINCAGQAGGAVRVTAQGGAPPYNFNWSDPKLEGSNPSGLKAGTYTVTVVDDKGLTKIAEVMLKEPTALEVSVEEAVRISEKGRKDGRARVQASGGTAPYQYLWANESKEPVVRRLAAGIHTITVTDASGCKTTKQVTIQKEPVIPELKEVAALEIGQTLQVNELYFKADSAVISDASHAVLNEVYQFLRQHNNVVVEIGGHTNSIPSDEYCNRLSTARAKNVAEYLYKKGISEKQLSYKGYGKTLPIASNKTVQGRRRNQRVEIKILDIGK